MSAGTKRSRRSGCLWMVLLSLLATFALNFCVRSVGTIIPVPAPEDTSTPHTVVITVGTTVPTDVNWSVGAQAGTQEVKTNWTRTFKVTGAKVVSVSAQSTGKTASTVTCTISVDGNQIDSASATKAGELASCTGKAG